MKTQRMITTLSLLGLLSLTGCSTTVPVSDNTAYFNAYDAIDQSAIMNLSSEPDVTLNYTDTNVMYQISPDIAIIRVDSIDGGSNYNEQTGEYIHAYTFGKMTVLQTFKGNLVENQQLNYIRMGGVISFDEYYKGLYPAEQSKLDANMKEKPEYVKQMFGSDIDIEAGKTYLMYIGEENENDNPLAKKDVYSILGWEGGLREIDGDPKEKSQIRVLNNVTGEWEALSDVIPA